MSPRTNWDPPESEGRQADIERYRRERSKALKRMGGRAKARGRKRPGGRHEEGDYRSPEEKSWQQDWTHDEGHKMGRDYNLNRMDKKIESGEANFSTEDAGEALARHKRQKKRHGDKLAVED